MTIIHTATVPARLTATQLTTFASIAAGLPMPLEGTVAMKLATLARARHSGVSPIRDAARALTASLAAFLASPVGIVASPCHVGIARTQSLCTRAAGHTGDHRCTAFDVDQRECNHGPGPCCRECCDDEGCERHDGELEV